MKLTANSDIGAATPAISATTANKVGVNQAAASVTLQVTGTDAVGLPSGTIAQRSLAMFPACLGAAAVVVCMVVFMTGSVSQQAASCAMVFFMVSRYFFGIDKSPCSA